MFNNIGTAEILIVILILILLFGSSKITDLARGLGEATNEIKKVKKEIEDAKEEINKETPASDKTSHLKKLKK